MEIRYFCQIRRLEQILNTNGSKGDTIERQRAIIVNMAATMHIIYPLIQVIIILWVLIIVIPKVFMQVMRAAALAFVFDQYKNNSMS